MVTLQMFQKSCEDILNMPAIESHVYYESLSNFNYILKGNPTALVLILALQ